MNVLGDLDPEDREQQLEVKRWSLCDIGDDCLSAVLSFLGASDVASCSAVCWHLRRFCGDDHKVWLPMCERRWGAHTSVQKWGGGRVRFRILHNVLSKLENLTGFWRGVGQGGHGSLVTFEWGPHYVIGHRVVQSRPGCYGVSKTPFVWVGLSGKGSQVCLYDPGGFCISPRKGQPEDTQAADSYRLSRLENSFRDFISDWDSDFLVCPPGLVSVDLHFVGKLHIVLEELQQPSFLVNRSLAEAAVSTSFGSRDGCTGEASSVSPGSHGSSPETTGHGQSPPGSFQYEMYQFLASKVTSKGGERLARKQRKKERERALQGRGLREAEHFVKVRNVAPTETRPLQGLWKGISDSKTLNFLLISYEEKGGIVCRRVGEFLGNVPSVFWTAICDSSLNAPLSGHEQHLYSKRQHFSAGFGNGGFSLQEGCGNEVVGMLRTLPVLSARLHVENDEGRVWLYADGRFGFGYLEKDYIVDYQPICSSAGMLVGLM